MFFNRASDFLGEAYIRQLYANQDSASYYFLFKPFGSGHVMLGNIAEALDQSAADATPLLGLGLRCRGFFASDGRLYTAKHCLLDLNNAESWMQTIFLVVTALASIFFFRRFMAWHAAIDRVVKQRRRVALIAKWWTPFKTWWSVVWVVLLIVGVMPSQQAAHLFGLYERSTIVQNISCHVETLHPYYDWAMYRCPGRPDTARFLETGTAPHVGSEVSVLFQPQLEWAHNTVVNIERGLWSNDTHRATLDDVERRLENVCRRCIKKLGAKGECPLFNFSGKVIESGAAEVRVTTPMAPGVSGAPCTSDGRAFGVASRGQCSALWPWSWLPSCHHGPAENICVITAT